MYAQDTNRLRRSEHRVQTIQIRPMTMLPASSFADTANPAASPQLTPAATAQRLFVERAASRASTNASAAQKHA